MKRLLFSSFLLSTSAAFSLPGYFDVDLDQGKAAVASLKERAQGNERLEKFADLLQDYLATSRRPDPVSREFHIPEYEPRDAYLAITSAIIDLDPELDACVNLKCWPNQELLASPDTLEGALEAYLEEFNGKIEGTVDMEPFREKFDTYHTIFQSRRLKSPELYAQFCNRYGLERKTPVETFILQALIEREAEENKILFDNGYGRTTYKMDGSYDETNIITLDNMHEVMERRRRPNCVLSAEERETILDALTTTGFMTLAENYGDAFTPETTTFTYSLGHQVRSFIQTHGPIAELGLADGSMLSGSTQHTLGLAPHEADQGFGGRFFDEQDMTANVMRVDITAKALPDVVGDLHDPQLYLTLRETQGTVSKIVDRADGCYAMSKPETMDLIKLLLGDEGIFEVWCFNSHQFDNVTRKLAELGFDRVGEDKERSTMSYKPQS